jgi:hypothetical protein
MFCSRQRTDGEQERFTSTTWRSCNPVVLLGGCVSDWISIISLVEEFYFWTTAQEVELVCSNQDANTPQNPEENAYIQQETHILQ